jgi:hypothetical protein
MLARRDRRAESVSWLDWVGGEGCLGCFDFEGVSFLAKEWSGVLLGFVFAILSGWWSTVVMMMMLVLNETI